MMAYVEMLGRDLSRRDARSRMNECHWGPRPLQEHLLTLTVT